MECSARRCFPLPLSVSEFTKKIGSATVCTEGVRGNAKKKERMRKKRLMRGPPVITVSLMVKINGVDFPATSTLTRGSRMS